MRTLSQLLSQPPYLPPSHTLLRRQPLLPPKPRRHDYQFFQLSRQISRPLIHSRINGGRNADESRRFLDDDGVVQDMDGYLNYLSLEYDSVWDTKPSWCQPWTIVLTGIALAVCSWLFLHSVIISALVFSLVSAWWYIFLYMYPKAYSEMIAERRSKVTNGVEDTFGNRKDL